MMTLQILTEKINISSLSYYRGTSGPRYRLYKSVSDWLEMLPLDSTGLNMYVPFQGNLGLKISRFSCMIHPIENAYNSVINMPTFTKFGSYIANFVYFENQL